MAADSEPLVKRVRVGCAGLPPAMSRQRYFAKLGLLETDGTYFSVPKPGRLRRWRDESPTAVFSLTVSQLVTCPRPRGGYPGLSKPPPGDLSQAGDFRDTGIVRDAFARSLAVAEVLSAEVLLFRTPTSFTPDGTHRERMRHFFANVVGDEARKRFAMAWAPQGVWSGAEAAAFARELDILYAGDPFAVEPGQAPLLTSALSDSTGRMYLRLTGLGRARDRFDPEELADLIDDLRDVTRAWVVFANPSRFRDARAMTSLLASS